MEYLGCRDPVNILFLSVSINQLFVSGHMSQHTELNLGIVRVLADLSAQFHTHGNVLQIRLCRADTPRGSNGLIEIRMDPAVLFNKSCQSVCIGGL